MATAATTETLVLTDQQGNYYVIPTAVIESAKVTDEKKKQELHQSVQGGDTTGFAGFGTSIQAQTFRLGGANLRALGNCKCSWNFDQLGRVRY